MCVSHQLRFILVNWIEASSEIEKWCSNHKAQTEASIRTKQCYRETQLPHGHILYMCTNMDPHSTLYYSLEGSLCDCILKMFAWAFLHAKAKVLIYLYIFHTAGEGMSRLRCSRHSSLLAPGRSDLGRWQRQRSDMRQPGWPASSYVMRQGEADDASEFWWKSQHEADAELQSTSWTYRAFTTFYPKPKRPNAGWFFRKMLPGMRGNTTPRSKST